MSRRDIRRMLLEPKRKLTDRHWVAPTLMGVVLLAGVGIGVAVGIGILASQPETKARRTWEQTEMALDRPPRHEEPPTELEGPPPIAIVPPPVAIVPPIVPPPLPRPGGPADDAVEAEANPELPSQASPQPEAPAQLAAVIPITPPVRPTTPGAPAWVRNSVAAPKTSGLPMIAVVIDDLGVDRKRSERVAMLRAPLTMAFMTYAENLPQATAAARQHGHELMVHVPMQPQADSYDPGPDVLEVSLPPEEIRRRLIWGLERFDGFVGINNHMGSRFTADRVGMRVVMEELKKRGLLFLDSVTTDKSVAPELARRAGVPLAIRNIFLDNEQSVSAIRAQLAKAEAHARKHGSAIAIGHPHDATIDALSQWLPGLEARGVVLVPISAILKAEGQ